MFLKEDFYDEILEYSGTSHSDYSIAELEGDFLKQLQKYNYYCFVKDYNLGYYSLCLNLLGEELVIDLVFEKVKNIFRNKKINFTKDIFFISKVKDNNIYDASFELSESIISEEILISIYNYFVNDSSIRLKFLIQNNIIF